MTGVDDNLSISLALTFTPSFAGTQNQYIQAIDHAGNSNSGGPYGTWTVASGTVATPTFSPAGGPYSSAQTVTLSTTTPSATISYTTNGGTPSPTNGTVYTGPITVSSSQTINAIAYESGWTNSAVGSASYTIGTGGTATYTFQTSPAGMSIMVDSTQYTAPQTFQWTPGSVHTIGVNGANQPPNATTVQYSYANWSDLGGESHTIIAPSGGAVYTANFTTQYYLTMTQPYYAQLAEVPGTVYPASGWYNAGSAVQVSAIPAQNFVFTGFSGGISGSSSPYVFTISQPTTVTSNFAIAQLIVTTPSPLPSAKVGVAYSQQLAATGGIPPYYWAVEGNTQLPQFFSISSTGVLHGTPTTSGTFGGFVYVQDSESPPKQAPYTPTFTITANDATPTVTCTPSASTVPLGQSYTFSASASGGTPGYTYSWTSYSTGASLGTTSTITLRASTLGAFTAEVTIQDSAGGSASASCSVTVVPATTTAATMLSPAPGSQLTGNSAIFQWGNAVGVSQYALMIGSSPGGSDLYNANTGLTDFATVTGLPTDGRTLYVTLSSFISGSWTANSYTYTAASTPSSLPIMPAPYTQTVAGPTPAAFTIIVNSSAGLSGTVSFTISGTPAGSTVSVNPPTLNGSGSTDLTITPASNSATGTFPVVVTASNGTQSVSTVVTLVVVAPSPATLLSPANGAMLNGGTAATFTWTPGFGATQYLISLGSTPGGADIASIPTGGTESQGIDLPCGLSVSQLYLTLSSWINGSWQDESYQFPWCDCGILGVLIPDVLRPAIQLISSEPSVLNNGQSAVGTYQVYNQIGGAALVATGIDQGSLQVSGQDVSAPKFSIHSDNDTLFDVTFTAVPPAAPGQRSLSLTWRGLPATLGNAVEVYDASPVITSAQSLPLTAPTGSFYIGIFGTNFGPAPGSVAVCEDGSTPCTTSDVTVSVSPQSGGTWNDNDVTLLVTPSSGASGVFDVQVTSGGEDPADGFFAAPQQGSQAQSNVYRKVCAPPFVTFSGTSSNLSIMINGSAPLSLPFTANITASGAPSYGGAGAYSWTTDNPSMITFSSTNTAATVISIAGPGRATISVTYTSPCATAATYSEVFVLSEDVTVVGWVDALPIQSQLPSGASPTLVSDLTANFFQCGVTLGSWDATGAGLPGAVPIPPVTTSVDQQYAQDTLLINSSNSQPPTTGFINSAANDTYRSNGDYRLFNRMQGYFTLATPLNSSILPSSFNFVPGRSWALTGNTPEPCGGQIFGLPSETNSQNGAYAATLTSVYQLAEGRIGPDGQNVNAYLQGTTNGSAITPWIWAFVQVDTNGNYISLVQGNTTQIFPTYYVYVNGQLFQTISEADVQAFIALTSASVFQIP